MLKEVQRLKGIHTSAAVKVTGHSLGAAMALLTGLDLIHSGIPTQMINFGQPRVGTDDFSAFVKTIWPEHWRVIHHRDMVPHNPASGIVLRFWHTCSERYEDKDHVMHACNNTCEDPTCAASVPVIELDITDHLNYLGKCMGIGCGNCRQNDLVPETFLQ